MAKEVIILGTSPSSDECPTYGNIWGVNGAYKFRPCSKVFITDKNHKVNGQPVFNVEEMNILGVPVVSRNHVDGLNCETYPYDEIVKQFNTEYFTNSICYVIAYALYKGFTKISLYGCEHLSPREYVQQKAGVEFWLGIAKGMGVWVKDYGHGTLFRVWDGVPYGFTQKEHKVELDGYGVCAYWKKIVEHAMAREEI